MLNGQAGLGTEHLQRPDIALLNGFAGDEVIGNDDPQRSVRGEEGNDDKAVLIEGGDP